MEGELRRPEERPVESQKLEAQSIVEPVTTPVPAVEAEPTQPLPPPPEAVEAATSEPVVASESTKSVEPIASLRPDGEAMALQDQINEIMSRQSDNQ